MILFLVNSTQEEREHATEAFHVRIREVMLDQEFSNCD